MANLGTTTNLVGGTLACTVPEGTQWWFVQNQDIAGLRLTFPADSGMTTVDLAGASSLGAGDGGYIDSIGWPYIGPFTLSSTVLTAEFGSGHSARIPVNSFARSV